MAFYEVAQGGGDDHPSSYDNRSHQADDGKYTVLKQEPRVMTIKNKKMTKTGLQSDETKQYDDDDDYNDQENGSNRGAEYGHSWLN